MASKLFKVSKSPVNRWWKRYQEEGIGDNGSSYKREVLKLPVSLPFLKNLTVGNIRSCITLNLPATLNELENFTAGNIKGTIKIPTLLPNLICLHIDTIEVLLSETISTISDLYRGSIPTLFSNPENLINLRESYYK